MTDYRDFVRALTHDWDHAMDQFFTSVQAQQRRDVMSDREVEEALRHGYGDDVAEAWREWLEE